MRRPRLWPAAFAAATGLVPRRWWRRGDHLPLPARPWLAFRMETAYGYADATPPSEDLLAFLEFVRDERRAGRTAGRRTAVVLRPGPRESAR